MKKTPSRVRDVRAEYDFSGGVRGKYAKRYAPLLAALLVFGCSDPLSPTDVAGRYQLQRLLSGHLILSADGSAEEEMHIEQHSGTGATIVVVQRTDLVYEGDALVETDGLQYVRSEITTQ